MSNTRRYHKLKYHSIEDNSRQILDRTSMEGCRDEGKLLWHELYGAYMMVV